MSTVRQLVPLHQSRLVRSPKCSHLTCTCYESRCDLVASKVAAAWFCALHCCASRGHSTSKSPNVTSESHHVSCPRTCVKEHVSAQSLSRHGAHKACACPGIIAVLVTSEPAMADPAHSRGAKLPLSLPRPAATTPRVKKIPTRPVTAVGIVVDVTLYAMLVYYSELAACVSSHPCVHCTLPHAPHVAS